MIIANVFQHSYVEKSMQLPSFKSLVSLSFIAGTLLHY